MILSPSKNITTKTERMNSYKSVPLHKIPLNAITPVKDLLKIAEAYQDRRIDPRNFAKVNSTCRRRTDAMSSTVLHAERNKGMQCELSSIGVEDSSLLGRGSFFYPPRRRTKYHAPLQAVGHNSPGLPFESPAKTFALMKAKVQKSHMSGQSGDGQSLTDAHCPRGARQEQDVLYYTRRKADIPCAEEDGESQEAFNDSMEVDAPSPSRTPCKVQGHRLGTSPRKITQRNRLLEHGFGRALQQSNSCNQLEPIPSSSCAESAGGEQRLENEESSIDGIYHDEIFQFAMPVVPVVPVKRSDQGTMRKNSMMNSPAKIFSQMKGMVELLRRELQGPDPVTSAADVNPRGIIHGPFDPRTTLMTEDEADDELSRDVDSKTGASSIAASLVTSPVESCSSVVHEEDLCSTHVLQRPLPEPEPEPLPDLANDSLLQASPRFTIPKKRPTERRQDRKEAKLNASEPEQSPVDVPSLEGVHLTEWQLKLKNSRLFVDGFRTDDKMPWHSNLISERLSSNVLKTVSGSVYVLVGKMVPDPNSVLPGSFLKKFLHGFPEKWKSYLIDYLSTLKRKSTSSPSETRVRAKARSSKTTKAVTPSDPKANLLPSSAKLSRSGRLIKPPLEYWKGGRVVLDSDMNVTIHEDYQSSAGTHLGNGKIACIGSSKRTTKTTSKASSAKFKAHDREAERTKPDASDRDTPGGSVKTPSSQKQLPERTVSNTGELLKQVVSNRRYAVGLTPLRTASDLHQKCSVNNLRYHDTGSEDPETPVPLRKLRQYPLRNKGSVREASPNTVVPAHQEVVKTRRSAKRPESEGDGQRERPPSSDAKRVLRHRSKSRFCRTTDTSEDESDALRGQPPSSNATRVVRTRNKSHSGSTADFSEDESDGLRGQPPPSNSKRVPRPRNKSHFFSPTDSSEDNGKTNAKGRVPARVSERTGSYEGRDPMPDSRRPGKDRSAPGRRASVPDTDEFSDPPTLLRSSSRNKRNVCAVGASPETARINHRAKPSQKEELVQESDTSSSFSDPPKLFSFPKAKERHQQGPAKASTASREAAPPLSNGSQARQEVLTATGSDRDSNPNSKSQTKRPLRTTRQVVKDRDQKASEDADPSHAGKRTEKKTPNPQRAPDSSSGVKLPKTIKPPERAKPPLSASSDSETSLPDSQLSLVRKKLNFPLLKKDVSPEPSPEKKRQEKNNLKGKNKNGGRRSKKEEPVVDGDDWTESELKKLQTGVSSFPKHKSGFWINVAMVVGTHSAEECQEQYTKQQSVLLRTKAKRKNTEKEPVKESLQITAKAGTLKRKQQMRNFLDHMPKDDHDDIFSSHLQNKRVKLPTLSTNGEDNVFQHLQQNPQTPNSSAFPSVQTPHCLHISPGMLGSVNRNNNDKYVFQLQRKMGKAQANVRGQDGCTQRLKHTPMSSVKPTKSRLNDGNESFVVWNMFSDKEPSPHLSDESGEEDYYFMDD